MDTCKCFSSIARRLYFHHRTLPRRCCRYRDNHDTRRSHACKYETANIHSGTRAYATCRSMIAVSPNLYTKVQTTKYLSIPGSRGDTQRGMIGRTLSNSGAVCQQDLHYTEQRDPNPGGLSVVDNAASTLLRSLPDRVVFMAAYGSGVLKQANTLASTNKNPPMIDFLIATDDPVTWHETNMQKNPSHYSGTGTLSRVLFYYVVNDLLLTGGRTILYLWRRISISHHILLCPLWLPSPRYCSYNGIATHCTVVAGCSWYLL